MVLTPVDNLWITLGKPVENMKIIHSVEKSENRVGDIHWFITALWTSYPLFSTIKNYKLISYAPYRQIVEK